jgi:hypothetical protein
MSLDLWSREKFVRGLDTFDKPSSIAPARQSLLLETLEGLLMYFMEISP